MQSFEEFSKQHKAQLLQTLNELVTDLSVEVLQSQRWKKVLDNMLKEYLNEGKMIRAMLTLYWAECYGVAVENNSKLFCVAASCEFLQAFLLIHDDIMDKDDFRRNMPSFHIQLKDYVCKNTQTSPEDSLHLGESLAICAGDILFSYAVKIVSTNIPSANVSFVLSLFTNYVCRVGEAQMDDMFWESIKDIPSQNEILNMYEGKTSLYTFTLPAILGYVYALGDTNFVDEKEINILSDVGSTLGKLFQICDDVLDIKSDQNTSGKTRGSDIINNKKTFFLSILLQEAQKNQQEAILYELLESNDNTQIIDKICLLADDWGVWDIIERECANLYTILNSSIEKLTIATPYKAYFQKFALDITKRNR